MKSKGKYMAKMIIILSGIILFAHSAIPHHHHQGQVCVETESFLNFLYPHEQDPTGHSHQHDPQNNLNRCFISEFIPVSSKDTYKLSSSDASKDKHLPDFNNIVLSVNIRVSTFFAEAEILRTDIQPYYSDIAHLTQSLRAPPVV